MAELFDTSKRLVADAELETADSLNTYGPNYDTWVIAWSGGKDSTCLLTLTISLIQRGLVAPPKRLIVLYADTRMELPPLAIGAQRIMEQVRSLAASPTWKALGCDLMAETVMAPLEKRFLCYILGRGIPPPNNNTLRWCTRQIKVDPMAARIEEIVGDSPDPVLVLTGVRTGESYSRDARIQTSCSRNGAECGQGWFQRDLNGERAATLAAILHWRVCHVWDWLTLTSMPSRGGWYTRLLAQAYGGDKAKELEARTGCNGCPLANNDTALDGLLERYPDEWGYLLPIKRLRPLWRELRQPQHRLRKHGERNKDGRLSKSPNRMGPLTMEARKYALREVLWVQDTINAAALEKGKPTIDMLNSEEIAHIEQCHRDNVWPDRWDGTEPLATAPYDEVFSDGTVQRSLFTALTTKSR